LALNEIIQSLEPFYKGIKVQSDQMGYLSQYADACLSEVMGKIDSAYLFVCDSAPALLVGAGVLLAVYGGSRLYKKMSEKKHISKL